MATRTAAQRRQQARTEYDAYLATCPARQLLDRISDKWVSLILTALAAGPRRYSDLSRTIAGVSQKMLTQTLRTLERDGLVARSVTASVPVRVDYTLTELGRSLLPVMQSIKSWAETHMDAVDTARTSYRPPSVRHGLGQGGSDAPSSRRPQRAGPVARAGRGSPHRPIAPRQGRAW